SDVVDIIKTAGEFVANQGCTNSGTYTNTWTVTDACGNPSAEFTQVITIEDTTPPAIESFAIQPIPAEDDCQAKVPDFRANVVITDNCSSGDSITITQLPEAGSPVQSGITTITITATDTCGNESKYDVDLIVTNFIVANDDTGSNIDSSTGGIAYTNVLSNDLFNCKEATTETVDINFVSSTNPGIKLEGTDVVVDPRTPSGNYILVYQICDKDPNGKCDEAEVTVTVESSTLSISPLSINNRTLSCDDTSLIFNFIENVTRGGSEVDLSKVNLTLSSDTDPKITLDELGNLNLENGLPKGTHNFEITACEILNPDNCASRSVTIIVDCQVASCAAVVVHKAFTPNWDGVNDTLVIDGAENVECYPSGISVEIYNRWGILVFEAEKYNNTTNAFDGYSRGRSTVKKSDGLPTGTYFYIVNYESVNGTSTQNNKLDGFIYLSR
ncbi:MAG TPA: gliding motility-associated C-terminal domain-containing protein, partial [Flavobacterium sp.]